MDLLRLFIAIWPSPEVVEAIHSFRNALAEESRDRMVRWIPKQNLHLTMQFLGDTEERRVSQILGAVGRSVAGVGSSDDRPGFDVTLAGCQAFPSARRPRVIVVGVTSGSEELSLLNAAIRRELRAEGIDFDPKPFRAHLTLGYVRRGKTPAELKALSRNIDTRPMPPASFRATTVDLVASELHPRGAQYSSIGQVALR
jgi:2'-5' RNA ligase